jgi:hypothetical protein
MVAASLRYSDWETMPRVVGTGGVGDGSVIIGQPPNPGRFPGDPNRTGSDPTRQIPRVPESNPSGQEKVQETPADEVCIHLGMQDGPFKSPSSGLLYFPFSSKLKSIHSLELVYETADGTKATLTLL